MHRNWWNPRKVDDKNGRLADLFSGVQRAVKAACGDGGSVVGVSEAWDNSYTSLLPSQPIAVP